MSHIPSPSLLSGLTAVSPVCKGQARITALMALLLCLALFNGCSGSPPASEPAWPSFEEGALLDPTGEPVSRRDFLRRARGAEYILIGETHTNACDHRVQARLLHWLAEDGVRAAVGLEMVPASAQKQLDRFNAGRIGLDELPEALDWEKTWGHPFSLYRPVLRAAQEAGYSVYGLNTDPKVLDAVRKRGRKGLPKSKGPGDPHELIPPSAREKRFLTREFQRHEQLLSRRNRTKLNRERFFLVQALWDSSMAAEAQRVRSRSGRTMILLAGNGHVAYGRGIPRRLGIIAPAAEILTVSGWRGVEEPDPDQSDFLFFCPLTYESRLGFSLKRISRGWLITGVEPGSRGDKAGMRSGDLLLAAGGKPFRELMDLHLAAVRAHKGDEPLLLRIERHGDPKELRLDISK